MENGEVESNMADGTEEPTAGLQEAAEEIEGTSIEATQLKGLVAELREGLHCALAELGELRQRNHRLEESLQSHLSDVDDKIMGLKNSLNTFKEELGGALLQVKEVSCRQREIQKKMEILHREHTPQSRKSSKGDLLPVMGEGHTCLPSQSDLSVIQHYYSSLTNSSSTHRSTASTQTSSSLEQLPHQRVWRERKNSREELDAPSCENRQRAALELLESERVYVSFLSLLLKANISFNGSESVIAKDKRLFPSSLRFLIQQHLELLRTLQERVIKCQWQGIMGDVFMKLTSKESDFLAFYVGYLKELPDCLSVVSMLTSSSMHTAAILECDVMGDESRPSLHTLLLQPVQRIPEYTLLLQGLLRQTEVDHPDYYLLLVSIQKLRSFTSQHQQLLQHSQEVLQHSQEVLQHNQEVLQSNQEVLQHNRNEIHRSSMKQLFTECGIQTNAIGSPYPLSNSMLEQANQAKRSKQRLLEHIQSRCYQDWDRDADPQPQQYHQDRPNPLTYFSPDPEPRNPKLTALRSIPESEPSETSSSCKHHLTPRPPDPHPGPAGSALAQALGEFLLPGEETAEMEGLCEGDGDSLHHTSLFDQCSSDSSNSSVDIAFVRCPKSSTAAHHATAVGLPSARQAYVSGGGGPGHRYSQFPRGCISPDEAVLMRHSQQRPLQASQRKSKSLNGLQLDSPVSCLDGGLGGGPVPERLHRGGLGSHTKLERQGSRGNKGCPTPTRRGHSSLAITPRKQDTEQHSQEVRSPSSKDTGGQLWGEEPKWRADEINHTPLSERSRKQEKGGFRSSFKRLFKKKNGDDKKEKETLSSDQETTGKTQRPLEADRGTAV